MSAPNVPDVFAWEKAFFRLYDWLEDDRDRRIAVISADNTDLHRVALYIDQIIVSAATGNSLPEVVTQTLEGMVIA